MRTKDRVPTIMKKTIVTSSVSRLVTYFIVVVALAALVFSPGYGFAQATATDLPGLYNPVANPKAVVTVGNVRFTVLAPQLIRMEWAADGKFEDHASLAFLNRNVPVPKFTTVDESIGAARKYTITTDSLTLGYMPNASANGRLDERSEEH